MSHGRPGHALRVHSDKSNKKSGKKENTAPDRADGACPRPELRESVKGQF